MKTTAGLAAVAVSLFVVAGLGAPAVGADTHYTVHCSDGSSSLSVVARAFDARLVEQSGGKAHAIELFKQTHPGGMCWITGPHPNHR
jgi:hypothetical protein